MNWRFLSFSLFFPFFSRIATLEQCDTREMNVRSMEPEFGGISGFYGIAKGISDGLQSTPNSKTYNDLNSLLFGNGDVTASQVAKDLILNQIGAIIFWSIGFVLVLVAIVLCFATAIWQCCFSCIPKNSRRSATCRFVLILLLIVAFSVILTGTILFNVAENQLVSSINNGQDYVENMNNDLDYVMTNGTEEISCQIYQTTNQIFGSINDQLSVYGNTLINEVEQQVGIADLNTFNSTKFQNQNEETINKGSDLLEILNTINFNDQKCEDTKNEFTKNIPIVANILNELSKASMELRENSDFQNMNDQIGNIKSNVQENANLAIQNINITQQNIIESMKSFQKMIQDLLSDVSNTCNSFQVAQNDITTSSEYSLVQMLARLLVTIPACIGMLFSILGIICLWICGKRVAPKIAPTLTLTAFYTSTILSTILLLLSSGAFVGGWATSAVCVPIFEDSTYRLFHLVNITTQTVIKGQSDNINVGEVFSKCRNDEETFFSAINGESIISTNLIDQNLNIEKYRDQGNQQIQNGSNNQISVLNRILQEFQNRNFHACAASNDVENSRSTYMTNLEISVNLSNYFYNALNKTITNTQNFKPIAIQINDAQFEIGGNNINNSFNQLMVNLQTSAFKCKPLVDMYSNVGNVVCRQYGEPIHGIWAAIGLTGIFMLIMSILLLFSYRWLKTEEELEERNDSTKIRGLRRYDQNSGLQRDNQSIRHGPDLWGSRKMGEFPVADVVLENRQAENNEEMRGLRRYD